MFVKWKRREYILDVPQGFYFYADIHCWVAALEVKLKVHLYKGFTNALF